MAGAPRPALLANQQGQSYHPASMVPHLFVIDDFLRNPDDVRAQALGMSYSIGCRYPGLNSAQKLRIEGLDQVISTLVREPIRAPWTDDFSHGSCRISLASDDGPARIHIDQSHWSGILYLSLPKDCSGGTEFYRHKRTQTDRVPMDPESSEGRATVHGSSSTTSSTKMLSTARTGSIR